MECKECSGEKPIVNKHFGLCQECNNVRLHGSKYGKEYNITTDKRKPLRSGLNKLDHSIKGESKTKYKKTKSNTNNNIMLDENFYQKCFDSSDHRCEECGTKLPNEFRNDQGKVLARWRYSHIVAKSIAPELRHDVSNINHLCLKHHGQWDHGDKKSMKIYAKNALKLPRYF